MQILRVSNKELQAFISDNIADLTEQQFTENYLDGVIDGLKMNAGLYRTYGGYWWPLKRLIQTRPNYPVEFGSDVDAELDKAFSHDTDAMTISAAYLEQQQNMASKMLTDTRFVYDTPDAESVELILEDADMERLLFAEQLLK